MPRPNHSRIAVIVSSVAWPATAIGPAISPFFVAWLTTATNTGPGTRAPEKPIMNDVKASEKICSRAKVVFVSCCLNTGEDEI